MYDADAMPSISRSDWLAIMLAAVVPAATFLLAGRTAGSLLLAVAVLAGWKWFTWEERPGSHAVVPDVALVWDWSGEQKKAKELLGLTDSSKVILIENRSDEWIYNVQIGDLKLDQSLAFDSINEIPPHEKVEALGRWDGRSSTTTEYTYFFTGDGNERVAAAYGWKINKSHNRGFSTYFLRLPFRVFYEWKGKKCLCRYDLTYEQMGPTFFSRVKCEPVQKGSK